MKNAALIGKSSLNQIQLRTSPSNHFENNFHNLQSNPVEKRGCEERKRIDLIAATFSEIVETDKSWTVKRFPQAPQFAPRRAQATQAK